MSTLWLNVLLSIWITFFFSNVNSIEYDENGHIIYNDYGLEYTIDDDQYFLMSVGGLLLWTLGSVFIGIIICGGTLIWYKRIYSQNKTI